MQVTILGANGRVGQEVVRICLERGHQVVALAHSHDPFTPQLGLIVLKGDIYKAGDIATAVQGSQAVISTLGSWGTKDKNVLESAMQQLIPVMQEQAIKRLVSLTGTGALYSGDMPKWYNKVDSLVLGLIAPKILSDGVAHLELLATSGLDWTCIRSPIITNGTSSVYDISLKLPIGMSRLSRPAVAVSLVDQLDSSEFLQQAPFISKA